MKDQLQYVQIMQIPFLNTTKEAFVNQILLKRLEEQQSTFVVTANPEIVMKTREDSTYRAAIEKATYIVPDGIGIIKAAQRMGTPLTERIAGFDVMQDLLRLADEKGFRCYFLGGEATINEKAVAEVKKRYPNIQVVGAHHGFYDLADEEIVESVRLSKPDLIFVALGLPRQEQWIAKHFNTFSSGVFIGVGGSFDVLAGEVRRAPDLWIKLNLEWAYRLAKQPFRLKRIFKVFQFMFLVMIGKGKS